MQINPLTTTSSVMTKQHAELIEELLTNAGWMDGHDELLAAIRGNYPEEVKRLSRVAGESEVNARHKLKKVNSLIKLINPFLDRPLKTLK